jgi:hypothetical protein
MDRNALILSLVIGTLIQLAMIVIGHFVPVVRDKVFMIGGLLISLVAGLIYAKLAAGSGWPMALAGGALTGGACALIGIGASVVWGDTVPFILVAGTLSSAVTGAIGGAIGKLLN